MVMCRLLALVDPSSEATKVFLSKFQELAVTGQFPINKEPGHLDGWGMAIYYEDEMLVMREPFPATDSELYDKQELELINRPPKLLMGHLRKASVGGCSLENTHPFTYKQYSFCHNGTFTAKIYLGEKWQALKKGSTDSEAFFLRILEINENLNDITSAIEQAIKQVKDTNEYKSLDCLFSDGDNIWAVREVNEKNSDVKEFNLIEDYYTLYKGLDDNSKTKIICSEELDISGIAWKLIPNHTVEQV
jgi:predicted glutamine amidotransferase